MTEFLVLFEAESVICYSDFYSAVCLIRQVNIPTRLTGCLSGYIDGVPYRDVELVSSMTMGMGVSLEARTDDGVSSKGTVCVAETHTVSAPLSISLMNWIPRLL